jgi:hypothetical protein
MLAGLFGLGRVILVPGPEAELAVVRWIFEACAVKRQTVASIVRALNARAVRGTDGQAWTAARVRGILQNENYIGNLVYFRTSTKLRSPRVVNPPDQWVRQVNGVRQIVIAELMVESDNYTSGYVEALILGTPSDQRVKNVAVKKRKGFSPENIARMEQEMETLERDFKAAEAGYGENVLHLTLAGAYIRKLLENVKVAAFLKAGHGDIFAEFEKVAAADFRPQVP